MEKRIMHLLKIVSCYTSFSFAPAIKWPIDYPLYRTIKLPEPDLKAGESV